MSNYILSHTGAQIDAAIEAALNTAGRNLADNADFQIWTRGGSVTVSDGINGVGVDRYVISNQCGTGATATIAQNTMLIDGVLRTCGKVSLSAAVNSFAAGKFFGPIAQSFEGRSLYRYLSPGKSFTVAVTVEVSVAGKYAFAVRNANLSSSYVHTATLAANNPTTVSFTVPIPAAGGVWTCPNTEALGLNLSLCAVGHSQYAAPSTDAWVSGNYFYAADCVNWTATAGATVKLTRVRLEEGIILGAHQAKSYDEDAARCAYFLPSIPVGAIGNCSWIDANIGFIAYPFKVPSRIAPTGILTSSGLTLKTTVFGVSTLGYNTATSNYVGSIRVDGSGAFPGGSSLIYTAGSGSIIFTGAEL